MPTSYPMSLDVSELTATFEDRQYQPQLIGSLGLFEYAGILGITAQIEKRGNTLQLVPTAARGGPATGIGRNYRGLLPVNVVHIPMKGNIEADEVLGERQFGTEDQPTMLQTRIAEVMDIGRQNIEYTMEWHRLGALKGQVLDADGSTVLTNMFSLFGVSQNTDTLDLSSASTKLRKRFDDFRDKIFDELGGIAFSDMEAVCGAGVWKAYVDFKEVRDTYLGTPDAGALRQGLGDVYRFGDITVRRYRGAGPGGAPMIADNEMYIYPKGVRGLFLGRFGCANLMSYVNRPGLPLYATGKARDDDTGYDIMMQSNPLHLCTRPRAVLKVTVTLPT